MRLRKRVKRFSIYVGVVLLLSCARVLPRRVTQSLLLSLGFLLFFLWKKVRMTMVTNLQKVYGDLIDARRFAFHTVMNLSRNVADFLSLPRMTDEEFEDFITVEGSTNVNRALATGRGIIAIGCHLGAWELIPAYFSQKGYRVNVVSRDFYDGRVGKAIDRIRESRGTQIIRREGSLTRVVRALKRGECVAVLIDQHTGTKGVWIDFMGRPAYAPVGVAVLAQQTGSVLLPVAIHRNSRGHTIMVDPPFLLDDSDLSEGVERCSKAVEKFITRYPKEWVWMHDRWRDYS